MAAESKINSLIDPEVMADIITAKIPEKISVTPFAAIDSSLVGVPGDTITVPSYAYIGDAQDVAEGAECDSSALTASSVKVTVKKAMKAVTLTDEAVLSGYGNPVGETNVQLAKAIAAKVDADAMAALLTAQKSFDGSAAVISYAGIVGAVDVFEEEENAEKVIFVHPKQVSQLRLDSDFISADKYTGQVVMTGEIGRIANCRVVPTKRVPLKSGVFTCPVVQLETENGEELPALTIYLKRDTNVETERHSRARTTDISADKYYAAALSNNSKVVLAKFKQS